MAMDLLGKVLRFGEGKKLKVLEERVVEVNSLEEEISKLSDDELRAKTAQFKQDIQEKSKEFAEEIKELQDQVEHASAEERGRLRQKIKETKEAIFGSILPEAFAVVREASRRTLGIRHFDVQIMGGIVLHEGKIAEMVTGEGKTLVATLPAYLNALESKGVHIVTVNDYLAKRDAQWMGPIYHFLGLSVGVIQQDAAFLYDPTYPATDVSLENLRLCSRQEAYLADITYGTNNEFGFDYLRDNMVVRADERAQPGHHFAIVDEVDSILIDEARTPLIISGEPVHNRQIYEVVEKAVSRLKSLKVVETVIRRGESFKSEAFYRLSETAADSELKPADELEEKFDYIASEKEHSVRETDAGQRKIAKFFGYDAEDLYAGAEEEELTLGPDEYRKRLTIKHIAKQAMMAHTLYHKDRDYVVKDGEVIIVDEFTGRLMPGRRYSEGLHEAIEAKEKVRVREEFQTLATITLQNYFRMYEKLAGMTGTAATEADEFNQIYNLQTVVIPTNQPLVRETSPDVIYKNGEAKFQAVVEDIVERHRQGQPVLVGTVSIVKSELLSDMLKRRGIPHQVLNAKYHEREAHIIAQAGRKATVTIATNMAGRGVDILLGGNPEGLLEDLLKKQHTDSLKATAQQKKDALTQANSICQQERDEVLKADGLHVLGTERHEARRIDNQLRGRSGRQGDPGSSQFYLSLEDDLMRLFGSDRIASVMERLNLPDDVPIEHGLVSKSIETAQRQVESQNFEIRKHVLEYDDVMNKQREVIYRQRLKCLEKADLNEQVAEIRDEFISAAVERYTDPNAHPENWDLDGLFFYLNEIFPIGLSKEKFDLKTLSQQELRDEIGNLADGVYRKKEEKIGQETMREWERRAMLLSIDDKWKEHLAAMDYLREGIGLRAVGQKDPLVEYKQEAFNTFQQLMEGVKEDFFRYIFHVELEEPEAPSYQVVSATGPAVSETAASPAASKEDVTEERVVAPAPEIATAAAPAARKVGRNDPCPCGSGKKYKKCCGAQS